VSEETAILDLVFFLVIFVLLSYVGLRLVRRARRSRVGTEPHCGKCDYLLIGIAVDRCPECGTVLDSENVVQGERRRPIGWIAASWTVCGLAVLFLLMTVRCASLIANAVNWYHFRSAASVMQDLKTGSGRPPPKIRTRVTSATWSHGWVRERVDLARVAFEELLRREKAGNLPDQYRKEIAELGLAIQQTWPNMTPVQYDLLDDLSERAAAGLLTSEQQARFFQPADNVQLKVRPIVIEGDEIPFELTRPLWGLSGQWMVSYRYESVQIDDRKVPLSPRFPLSNLPDSRTIPCPSIGKHSLNIVVDLNILRGSSSYHSAKLKFSMPFEVVAPVPENAIKLFDDPAMAAKIATCVKPLDFKYNMWHPGQLYGALEVLPVPVNVGFDVFARYDDVEYPVGRVTMAAGALRDGFRCDSELKKYLPKPPPTIDLVLRSSPKAARATLNLYQIWNGEIVIRDVPITDVAKQ